jgi:hypothetical protein
MGEMCLGLANRDDNQWLTTLPATRYPL